MIFMSVMCKSSELYGAIRVWLKGLSRIGIVPRQCAVKSA